MPFESKDIFQPGGCAKCNDLGFKGRGGIMEIMEIGDQVKGMILKEANDAELRQVAVEQGMITLQRAGLNKVFEGLTSIDEILRITSSV